MLPTHFPPRLKKGAPLHLIYNDRAGPPCSNMNFFVICSQPLDPKIFEQMMGFRGLEGPKDMGFISPKNEAHVCLVGGFDPFEKYYVVKLDHLPQVSG